MIHPVIVYLLSLKSQHHADCALPLFIALISGQEEIVRLFFDNGVQLEDLTKDGDNIFHVLVHYSKSQPKKAYKCYCLLWDVASKDSLDLYNPLTSRPGCMPGSRYTGVGVLFFVI